MEKIIELKDDAFESCLASDTGNNQPLIIKKSGEIIAEFVLKPLSQGELMEMERADAKYDMIKGLSTAIINHKIKQGDGVWIEGTKMTEALLKNLQPLIFIHLTKTLLKMTHLTKPEEKN